MALKDRLTRLRLAKDESLQQVADAVGASKAHIWQLEKGRTDNPSMALLRNLADHFALTVAALVGEDPEAAEDAKLRRMFRQAGDLGPEDVDLLDDMMQMLLRRRKQAKYSGE
jgi:transcriptional regulator with XRE-family HTH domain